MKKINQKLTELEKGVLKHFLERNQVDKEFFGRDFEELKVTNRRMTGVGFFTDISTSKSFKELRLKSMRWGNTRATLNNSLDIGFLIYVDNYLLTTIEAYTYGDSAWPEQIISFIVRDLKKDEF